MHYAMNQLSEVAPTWVQQHVSPEWYTRYGLRSDQARLPKSVSSREALARRIEADGFQLLEWLWTADPALGLCCLSALETLRQIWPRQYDRCTVPRREVLRWRSGDEPPPSVLRIASPCDLEARYRRKCHTNWVGHKLHLTRPVIPASPI